MKRLYCQFAMSFCFGDEFAEINAQNVEGRCDHLNTDRYHLCQWRIYIVKFWTPRGPNSFNFMQFLGKIGKIVCWRPPGEFVHPPRGNPGSATVCSTDDLPIRCSNGQHTFLGILGMSKALVYSRLLETQGYSLVGDSCTLVSSDSSSFRVYNSVCKTFWRSKTSRILFTGGGVSASLYAGIHPPPGAEAGTPQEQTPPRDQRQVPPPEQTPPTTGRRPSGADPLGAVHAGRYREQAGGTHPIGMQSCFRDAKSTFWEIFSVTATKQMLWRRTLLLVGIFTIYIEKRRYGAISTVWFVAYYSHMCVNWERSFKQVHTRLAKNPPPSKVQNKNNTPPHFLSHCYEKKLLWKFLSQPKRRSLWKVLLWEVALPVTCMRGWSSASLADEGQSQEIKKNIKEWKNSTCWLVWFVKCSYIPHVPSYVHSYVLFQVTEDRRQHGSDHEQWWGNPGSATDEK